MAAGQEHSKAVIRPASEGDHDAIWSIIEPAIRAGETLALARDLTREEALAIWTSEDRTLRVLEEDGAVLGVFYIRANQSGGGAHVANAGYVTAADAMGRGIARAMCAASLELAREMGFRAMQYNFVIASYVRAVALWQSMDFHIVGRIPAAFAHPRGDYVDALVMYHPL